jgi:hypothetical protein
MGVQRSKMRGKWKIKLDDYALQEADQVLSANKKRLSKFIRFIRTAFIANEANVNPGNFGTNLQGGAEFGYISFTNRSAIVN